MPCCQSHAYQPQPLKPLKNQFSSTVVVDEESLALIFSFREFSNSEPVQLRRQLFQPGTIRFVSLEAELQKSYTGKPGPHEGRYAGKAIFEKQPPGPMEARKSFLPLLLELFS